MNSDILFCVFKFLDLKDVPNCLRVCKLWREVGNSSALWDHFCEIEWKDKVFVPEFAKKERVSGRTKNALKYSFEDVNRCTLTAEELCSFDWNFRFKQSAGAHWVSIDPYWSGGDPLDVKFLRDGTVLRKAMNSMIGPVPMTWSFFAHPSGQRVLLRINGRSVPSYIIGRHKANWGFTLQSCWAFYTSFPMPKLGQCPELEDSALPDLSLTQQPEIIAYNFDLPLVADQGAGGAGIGAGVQQQQQYFQLTFAGGQVVNVPIQVFFDQQLDEDGNEEEEDDDDLDMDEEDEEDDEDDELWR